MKNHEQAHRLFMEHTGGTGHMDRCYYGPSNRAARRDFLEAWTGGKVTLSASAWRVFTRAVYALYGAPMDECIAARDRFVTDRARAVDAAPTLA